MFKVRNLIAVFLLALVGCGDDGGSDNADASVCPDNTLCVAGLVQANETWPAAQTVLLTDKVFVTDGATLTIEAGTTIQGADGAALVIAKGGSINAVGTAAAPIVFTSAKPTGQRQTGDWAGVALLGDAPINVGAEDALEGIDAADDNGKYGGATATANCGTMQYVRIEFAGDELTVGNELNGLTIGACGSDTTLEFIQVHRGKDDGIEFFGGTANMKNIVISGANDDSLDWDQGWQGKGQFIIVKQLNEGSPGTGFESDNNGDDLNADPRSQPELYNVTMVGTPATGGMLLREGTWAKMQNFIIMNFGTFAVNVDDAETAAGTQNDPRDLTIENSIFFNNGADGMTHFRLEEGADDDDGGFDELNFFTVIVDNNLINQDPMLGDAASDTAPNFVPAAASPAVGPGATPPDDGFFDVTATYMGAIEPDGTDWTAGWTAYPEN